LKRAFISAALGAAALGLVGCAGAPQPKPTQAIAIVTASRDVNSTQPIVVRLYELKQADSFNSADYFALVDHEQETLGASLISRDERELSPGESWTVALTIPPEAHYVAVIAGYVDIRSARWKALTPVPDKWLHDRKHAHRLTVQVGRDAVAFME